MAIVICDHCIFCPAINTIEVFIVSSRLKGLTWYKCRIYITVLALEYDLLNLKLCTYVLQILLLFYQIKWSSFLNQILISGLNEFYVFVAGFVCLRLGYNYDFVAGFVCLRLGYMLRFYSRVMCLRLKYMLHFISGS